MAGYLEIPRRPRVTSCAYCGTQYEPGYSYCVRGACNTPRPASALTGRTEPHVTF